MKPTLSRGGLGDIHEEAAARLQAQEQRYTRGRKSIVEVLDTADRPLTVPEIAARAHAGSLPYSSAYRNLTALVDAGVVHRVTGTDDHGRFELSEDLAGHHHHLLCDTCGMVSDISAYPRLERALTEAARVALEETGFEVTGHRIDLLGRCAGCAS